MPAGPALPRDAPAIPWAFSEPPKAIGRSVSYAGRLAGCPAGCPAGWLLSAERETPGNGLDLASLEPCLATVGDLTSYTLPPPRPPHFHGCRDGFPYLSVMDAEGSAERAPPERHRHEHGGGCTLGGHLLGSYPRPCPECGGARVVDAQPPPPPSPPPAQLASSGHSWDTFPANQSRDSWDTYFLDQPKDSWDTPWISPDTPRTLFQFFLQKSPRRLRPSQSVPGVSGVAQVSQESPAILLPKTPGDSGRGKVSRDTPDCPKTPGDSAPPCRGLVSMWYGHECALAWTGACACMHGWTDGAPAH